MATGPSIGRFEASIAEARRAIDVWTKALGPDAPEVGDAHGRVADVLAAQHDHAAAELEYREALRLLERTLGPDQLSLAAIRSNLAATLAERGKFEEAEVESRRSLAALQATLDREQPLVAQGQTALAKILLARDRPGDALEPAESAWTRLQRDDVPSEVQAEAAFVLARAVWETSSAGTDRARAHDLAERARAGFEAAPEQYDASVTVVRAWIEAHR